MRDAFEDVQYSWLKGVMPGILSIMDMRDLTLGSLRSVSTKLGGAISNDSATARLF